MNDRYVHAAQPHIVARNCFEIIGDVVRIELSQGEYAVCDLADLPLVAAHRWCAACFKHNIYAITQVRDARGRQVSVRLHRLIVGVTDPTVCVDHRNLDGLDNRRQNLRRASRKENTWNCPRPRTNTSGYKGVTLDTKSGRYTAGIKVNGKTLHLGRYTDPVEAARAYDEAAHRHHGAFARTNF